MQAKSLDPLRDFRWLIEVRSDAESPAAAIFGAESSYCCLPLSLFDRELSGGFNQSVQQCDHAPVSAFLHRADGLCHVLTHEPLAKGGTGQLRDQSAPGMNEGIQVIRQCPPFADRDLEGVFGFVRVSAKGYANLADIRSNLPTKPAKAAAQLKCCMAQNDPVLWARLHCHTRPKAQIAGRDLQRAREDRASIYRRAVANRMSVCLYVDTTRRAYAWRRCNKAMKPGLAEKQQVRMSCAGLPQIWRGWSRRKLVRKLDRRR